MGSIKYAGLIFSGLTVKQLFERVAVGNLVQVVTVNAEFIVEAQDNLRLRNIINNSFSTFDGEIPYRRACRQNPGLPIEKISGSDLCFDLFEYAVRKSYKVFVLGGSEESNKDCCIKVRDRYGVAIEGFSPPNETYPFSTETRQMITEVVRMSAPDIMLVCFGAVKQEFWIDDNRDMLEESGCKIAIGAGGTVDFLSGRFKRAPIWIQSAGLEGLYRFLQEPKLFRLHRLIRSLKLFSIVGA